MKRWIVMTPHDIEHIEADKARVSSNDTLYFSGIPGYREDEAKIFTSGTWLWFSEA